MKTVSQKELCHRIILAIAEAEEVPPRDLPALGNAIDVEALQAFLQSSSDTATAEFEYLDRIIKLTSDGNITIRELNEQDQYVTRCTTCEAEKRDVVLEVAQEFFTVHVDQSHAVEIYRSGGVEHQSLEDSFDSETRQAEETD